MKNFFKIVVLALMITATTQTFASTSKDVTTSVNNTVNQTGKFANNIVDKTSSGLDRVYTDGTNAVGTVYNDLKAFSPKVEAAIKEMAKGLKVGTQYVWGILIKQQQVWSWCYLLGFILAALTWIKFSIQFHKSSKEAKENKSDWSLSNIILTILYLGIALTFTVLSAQNLEPMMTGFINPEFGALRNIVKIASQLK